MADRMLPAAVRALERLARAAGYDVGFPKGQWCCGLIAANAGNFEEATNLHSALTASLRDSKGPVVTPSASCFGAITLDSADWGAEAPPADRFRDSIRFALELLERRPALLDASPERRRVAYHDSCQSLRQLGLKAEPRRLLELAGYEPVDIPDIANCCGFGGTFSFEWPEVAARLADWKLDAIAKTGCEIVASDNPGCLVHLQAAARRRRQSLRIAHVLELVAERLA
jgi:L-lactate dehydrogenase complex protein LldE